MPFKVITEEGRPVGIKPYDPDLPDAQTALRICNGISRDGHRNLKIIGPDGDEWELFRLIDAAVVEKREAEASTARDK
jgi:hypothetical protein